MNAAKARASVATLRPIALAGASIIALIAPRWSASAQTAEQIPPRPRLQAEQDTNSWTAYYWYGVERLTHAPEEASNAFYWAMRLDPSAPEPYYARGLALLAGDTRLLFGYILGVRSIVEAKEVRQADSLMHEGMRRNPFMQRTLDKRVLEEHLGTTIEPAIYPEQQGYRAYNKGQMGLAATKFAAALKDYPARLDLRVMRAHALMLGGDGDSAAVELTTVVSEMRKRDQKRLVSFYSSKALYEYEIGVIHMSLGHPDAARDAFGRALTEDLSFYPAHSKLGLLAVERGDTTAALAEYEQAAQLRPKDGMAHLDYGVVLLKARRFAEAEAQLRTAVELEPYFATARYDLALALDLQGKKREAIEPYRSFATRAPRTMETQIALALDRADTYAATLDPVPATSAAGKPPEEMPGAILDPRRMH